MNASGSKFDMDANRDQQAIENLSKISNIIVLMLENRSFDQMLGFLTVEKGRDDVDGLKPEMANEDSNGTSHSVFCLSNTIFAPDPGHEGSDVDQQLANSNGGFIKNFEQYAGIKRAPNVMGFHDSNSMLVFDRLAQDFLVCDRWFSSVPGATWPNRLYALTGGAAGSRDNTKLPKYKRKSFVRHLNERGISWDFYAHDWATIRSADEDYFYRWKAFPGLKEFQEHAEKGQLPAVSWIDPRFIDNPLVSDEISNDDHPPSDVIHGQALVLKVYNALLKSPQWQSSLLVITYDEHGGFFDHVPPEEAQDDDPRFGRYGCRVPAIVVSPWIDAGSVSKMVFDHTSIVKTILLRFCRDGADDSIPHMSKRVDAANHLGHLLTRTTPRPGPLDLTAKGKGLAEATADPGDAVSSTADLERRVGERLSELALEKAMAKGPSSEFQQGILRAKEELEQHRSDAGSE